MPESPQETVIVRDRDGMRQLEATDEWTSTTLTAALSADPRSYDELARAWLRYQPDRPLEDLPWVDCAGEPDGPWVLLDLACQRIVSGGGAELPDSPGAYQRDKGPWHRQMPVVWIVWPPHWKCQSCVSWQEALPPIPGPVEPLDARGILFGRPLAAGIARRVLDLARSEALPVKRFDWSQLDRRRRPTAEQRATAARWHELTVRVHADWLMTPREDLEGQTPRDFLHRGREWIDLDLDHRQQQWSNEGQPPRPLDRDTFAYRHGPLGTHEVVMYFDLCREVIGAAWDQIVKSKQDSETELTEVLHQHAQRWLSEGSIDDDPMPPAEIIDRERRRLPLTGDGMPFDCDCPVCRMEAENHSGPMFRGFDGHHLELDDEFAFSLCETRQEWEQKQRDYEEFNEKFERERKALAEKKAAEGASEVLASVWTSSSVDQESVDQAGPFSPLSVMGLAMRLAELVDNLKSASASRTLIDSVNEAFDDYRHAAYDPVLSGNTAAELAEVLEQIAADQPQLTAKVADLQSLLDERQRRIDASSSS